MTCPPSQSSALLTKGSTKQPVNDSNVEYSPLMFHSLRVGWTGVKINRAMAGRLAHCFDG